jgi:hypothetical protein
LIVMVENNLIEKFLAVETSGIPDFNSCTSPLQMGLWVLWVSKEKIGIKKLTAEEIATVIREVKEVSIDARSITYSFTPARGKVHIYHDKKQVYFEIMKSGKDYLLGELPQANLEVFYFQPGLRFSSKRILSQNILEGLTGELSVVDPYCSERTLDIVGSIKKSNVNILTKIDNLNEKDRERFLRELKDFKSENTTMKFRNYTHNDLHDRYIICEKALVILGHSLKDLGSKESFAIVLEKVSNRNIVEALTENFNRRWKQALEL